ncbi:MAG: pantoate--beta-alanine ligase [Pseudomonadales bacterium]|nr:pantoate--beta-alanine ligase [Pseudomonadales bacterium]
MQILESSSAVQQALTPLRAKNKTIAFVPTMGNLHEGHLSLVQRAKQEADIVIVSIFVNPLQFGEGEDLDKYPRTMKDDQEKLKQEQVDFLFTPTVDDIYPHGMANQTQVSVPNLGSFHCGSSRPGHFDGVTTVVNKLFNIVQPQIAVFGEKDFQQLAIIRKMVSDLCMPVSIIGAATGRAEDGLALSSRNQYLSPEQRLIAPQLNQVIQQTKKALANGEKITLLEQQARDKLDQHGFKVDYFNIVDADTLDDVNLRSREIVILAAAFLGTPRLIDNQTCPLNPKAI